MRLFVGFVLVAAALLKVSQLLSDPAVAHINGPILLPLQIGAELGLGIAALTGLYWRYMRWLALACFTAFACYSLYLATSGATSCGCFGPVHVHPWWTFLLDVVIVCGLIASLRQNPQTLERPGTEASGSSGVSLYQRIAVATLVLVVITSVGVLTKFVERRTANASNVITATDGIVLLEPETWIGKKLPIAEHIDVDLSVGEWTVLLHRHDCSTCQQVLPQFIEMGNSGKRVALIEVPPYGDTEPQQTGCRVGKLNKDREWFVQTPVEITLLDNVVTAAKVYEH